MTDRSLILGFVFFMSWLFVDSLDAQLRLKPADFFLSTQYLFKNPENTPHGIETESSSVHTLYFYWTTNGPSMSEINNGGFFEFSLSEPLGEFTAIETYDFAIVDTRNGEQVGNRWGDAFGPGTISNDGQTATVNAFTVGSGDGILNQNGPNSTSYLDQGYDAEADAFLIGKVEVQFSFISLDLLDTQIIVTADSGGIVNNLQPIHPVFGKFGFYKCLFSKGSNPIPGDINIDLDVNLVDIPAFIDMFFSGEFVCEGDINQDGQVDLNDVGPFIDLLLQQ